MKKIISLILALCIILPSGVCTPADAVENVGTSRFVKVKIPFPDEIEDYQSWLTRARYKDSGEVIPLSMAYDGSVYATIPVENKNREIEAFVPEELTFTDEDSSSYDFHNFKMLSRVGVIKGNDRGEANIYDNVTRAEAVAMVMRFLGLNKVAMQGTVRIFDDVTSDKWFYREVLSAYYYGLVKGDSEKTFSPLRDVTREEVTVMIARALQYAGLRCSESTVTNYADEDKISHWARQAYELMERNLVSDYDDTDRENPVRLLNPQKPATRADIAYILNNTQDDCQMYASDLAVQYGFDKEMPVIDGSTSTYPFTQAVYGALFRNGQTHPQYPRSHSKSHASYQRLINGEVDMLFASVYPASDIVKMAEEKGVELELIPIAYDAMIFFTNKENPIEGITKEQISDIYVNNAYKNWSELGGSDALLYPYCRNNDSGSHAQMERHFLNGNQIHPEVQKETSYTMSNVLTDVISAKTDNPVGYGLGYSIYYYYHNVDAVLGTKQHLKLLAIDGVEPSDKTIADGTYPLSNNTYVVLRKDTPKDSPARRMAEFMLTEAGQMCVENAGYGRLKKSDADMTFTDRMNLLMPDNTNYMFSPISVKTALMMAANGADGETREEILEALDVEDIDEYNQKIRFLLDKYSESDVTKLNISNSLWINSDKTPQRFSKSYTDVLAKTFDATAEVVNGSNAEKRINGWVNEKTEGKIPQIVDKNSDFWAMLVNAVYFKGRWLNEFNKGATKKDVFTSRDGTASDMDFMNRTAWMSYAKTDGVSVIALPYLTRQDVFDENGEYVETKTLDGVNISMYLMTSDDKFSPEEIISKSEMNSTYVALSVPKFSVEYSTGLNDMLKTLGISRAFSPNAEFEKMFDNGNMWIDSALHKTYIKVDEEGTEAAAVTSVGMAGSARPPEPIEVKFNKPFTFVIRDIANEEILFVGEFAFDK